MLTTDPTMPAGHVWERLFDEHDITASYSIVRKYIAERRGCLFDVSADIAGENQ